MKTFIKITVCAVSAIALLGAGYSFGLLVQDKHDRRIAAALQLDQAVRRHKAATLGSSEYLLREARGAIANGEMHLEDGLDFSSLPYLLRESFYHQWDTGYHRVALAHLIGYHQAVQPGVPYPEDLRAELTAFVPQTDSEQRSLDCYAKWDPAGY